MSLSSFPSVKSQYVLSKIPKFRTKVIEYGNKIEQRISFDSAPQFILKLTFSRLSPSDGDLIKAFFETCKGKYTAFYLIAEDETTRNVLHAINTTYSLNQIVRPITKNGHSYKCITAGVSGGSAPTFPTGTNATVGDNTVVWRENTYTVRFNEDAVNMDYFQLNLYKFGIVEFLEVVA